jgi:hypothetical protein
MAAPDEQVIPLVPRFEDLPASINDHDGVVHPPGRDSIDGPWRRFLGVGGAQPEGAPGAIPVSRQLVAGKLVQGRLQLPAGHDEDAVGRFGKTARV